MESSKQNSNIILKSKDIVIKHNASVKSVVDYSIYLMKHREIQEINFSSIGEDIKKLIQIVEILKIYLPGIYQNNNFKTIYYENIGLNQNINPTLYPKLEITLSKKEPIIKKEGYQGSLSEEKRKIIEKNFNRERIIIKKRRHIGKMKDKQKEDKDEENFISQKLRGRMGILAGEVHIIMERRIRLRKAKSNMIKREERKEIINIFSKMEIESELNDFINPIQIKQHIFDDEDKIFNELKNKENKILNEIIISKKKLFDGDIKKYLVKSLQNLYDALSKFEKGILYEGKNMIDFNNREILNLNNKYEFFEFKYLSILAIGQKNVGKSKLINEIKKIKEKKSTDVNKQPYFNIIEKNIINLNENEEVLNKIRKFIHKQNNFNDQNNSIRCIWYFIKGNNQDLKEIKLLELIKNQFKNNIPIIIIYSQATNKSDFDKAYKEFNEKGFIIIPVLSERIELFGGLVLEPHGLDNLLRETLEACKKSFKDEIFENILDYTLKMNIECLEIINKERIKNNYYQIKDDIISNYNNFLDKKGVIQFIVDIFLKNIQKYFFEININAEDFKYVIDFINNNYDKLIEYYNMNISNILNPILKDKAIELLNEQVKLEKIYNMNMLIKNKRDLNEFEKSIELTAKNIFLNYIQLNYIAFLIKASYFFLSELIIDNLNKRNYKYVIEDKKKEFIYSLEQNNLEFFKKMKEIYLGEESGDNSGFYDLYPNNLPPAKNLLDRNN